MTQMFRTSLVYRDLPHKNVSKYFLIHVFTKSQQCKDSPRNGYFQNNYIFADTLQQIFFFIINHLESPT